MTKSEGSAAGGHAPVDITAETRGDTLHIILRSDIVRTTLFPIKEALYRALDEHKPTDVEIDMSGVTYADSSGFGMLLEFRQSLRQMEGELHLLRPSKSMSGIMRSMALDRVFDIRKDPDGENG